MGKPKAIAAATDPVDQRKLELQVESNETQKKALKTAILRMLLGLPTTALALFALLQLGARWEPARANPVLQPPGRSASLDLVTPPPASVVGLREPVVARVTLPDADYFVYAAVTMPNGRDVVQDYPLIRRSDGLMEGAVVIGSAAEGPGQAFRIRIIATPKELPPGAAILDGVISSNAITVVRSSEGRNGT